MHANTEAHENCIIFSTGVLAALIEIFSVFLSSLSLSLVLPEARVYGSPVLRRLAEEASAAVVQGLVPVQLWDHFPGQKKGKIYNFS